MGEVCEESGDVNGPLWRLPIRVDDLDARWTLWYRQRDMTADSSQLTVSTTHEDGACMPLDIP